MRDDDQTESFATKIFPRRRVDSVYNGTRCEIPRSRGTFKWKASLRSWLYHVPRLINSNGQWKFIYNGTILRIERCERRKEKEENKTGEICRAQLSSGSWKQRYSSRSTITLERRCSACELWPTFIPAFLESKTRPKNEEYSTRIVHSLECDSENGSR